MSLLVEGHYLYKYTYILYGLCACSPKRAVFAPVCTAPRVSLAAASLPFLRRLAIALVIVTACGDDYDYDELFYYDHDCDFGYTVGLILLWL